MTTTTTPLHCEIVSVGDCTAVLHRLGIGALLIPEGHAHVWSVPVQGAIHALRERGWELCEDEEGRPALLPQRQTTCCGRQIFGTVVSGGARWERLAALPAGRFDVKHMAAEAVIAHSASVACCA